MKYLDTSVFVRYMVEPGTRQDVVFNQLAGIIFSARDAHENEFSTTEAVVAEVVFDLLSPHYAVPRSEIARRVSSILSLEWCRMPGKDTIIEALTLWAMHPKLSFVDAHLLCVARHEAATLVTFDTALAKAAGMQRWDLRSNDADHATNVEMP